LPGGDPAKRDFSPAGAGLQPTRKGGVPFDFAPLGSARGKQDKPR